MYSIVVSVCKNFITGLTAFLNSFETHHNMSDFIVYVLYYPDIDSKWRDDQSQKRKYLKFIPIDNNPKYKDRHFSCKIDRFNFASNIEGVVGLFDADMYFCSSMRKFFEIADKCKLIIGGANGSNFRFDQSWRDKYQISTIPDLYDYKTISSVPLILDTEYHGIIWKSIYNHKMTIGIGADFDLTNIYMAVHNRLDDLFVIPSQQITGIHHYMIKHDTRAMKVDGKMVTRDGLEIFMVHGKWWQPNYYEGYMNPMLSYAKGREDIIKNALESRELLKNEFEYYLNLG